MASADWLGKGPSPVRQVSGGYSRGGGVVKVKDTEQDGVGQRRPALSIEVQIWAFKFTESFSIKWKADF